MQVDCQDFLYTISMHVVSTTWGKFANIKLHQVWFCIQQLEYVIEISKARFPLAYFAAAGENFRQQNTLLVVLWLHKQKVK